MVQFLLDFNVVLFYSIGVDIWVCSSPEPSELSDSLASEGARHKVCESVTASVELGGQLETVPESLKLNIWVCSSVGRAVDS